MKCTLEDLNRLLQDPQWEKLLNERQRKEVSFCCEYVSDFNHGTDGHLVRTVVNKMAIMLDMIEDYMGDRMTEFLDFYEGTPNDNS